VVLSRASVCASCVEDGRGSVQAHAAVNCVSRHLGQDCMQCTIVRYRPARGLLRQGACVSHLHVSESCLFLMFYYHAAWRQVSRACREQRSAARLHACCVCCVPVEEARYSCGMAWSARCSRSWSVRTPGTSLRHVCGSSLVVTAVRVASAALGFARACRAPLYRGGIQRPALPFTANTMRPSAQQRSIAGGRACA